MAKGSATTVPFNIVVLNDLSRYRFGEDVMDRMPQLGGRSGFFNQAIPERPT
jgi:phosphoketolase